MDTVTDLELIEHSQGGGPAEARERIEAQLAASPELRQRQAELAALWGLLGSAEADLPERDLWPDLAAKLQYEPARQVALPLRLPYWTRVAATVALATCIGYGTARMQLGRQAPELAVPNETEVAETLQLAALSGSTYGQLADSLLGDETTE